MCHSEMSWQAAWKQFYINFIPKKIFFCYWIDRWNFKSFNILILSFVVAKFSVLEHLRVLERNDKDASKPVANFNLPNNSKQHLAVSGLSLNQGNSESRQTLDQKIIQIPGKWKRSNHMTLGLKKILGLSFSLD